MIHRAAVDRRTLVWDLGGVLLRWEPVALVRQAMAHLFHDGHDGQDGQDGQDADRLTDRLFQSFVAGGDWEQFDRGRIGLDELAVRMAARTGLARSDVDGLLAAVPGHLRPVPPVAALLAAVRAAGHRVVFLSNMPGPFADHLEADPDFCGWFADGVFSCRVGAVKPQPEIFEIAADRLGLEPAATTFIDDRQVNVEAARRLGWAGVHFSSAEQLAAELARGGWL